MAREEWRLWLFFLFKVLLTDALQSPSIPHIKTIVQRHLQHH